MCQVFRFDYTLPGLVSFFFFFNDTATTEIYTLSLHDALPILHGDLQLRLPPPLLREPRRRRDGRPLRRGHRSRHSRDRDQDRKSTRLNSSHDQISYAVFCLKKKIKNKNLHHDTEATPLY